MSPIRPLALALTFACGSVFAQSPPEIGPDEQAPTVAPMVQPRAQADVTAAPPTSTAPPARTSSLITRVPRFDELDVNGNGELERDEFAANMDVVSLLLRYDRTGNGRLNKTEYASYLADRQRYARLKATTAPERR